MSISTGRGVRRYFFMLAARHLQDDSQSEVVQDMGGADSREATEEVRRVLRPRFAAR
jgi:hypothetical protein